MSRKEPIQLDFSKIREMVYQDKMVLDFQGFITPDFAVSGEVPAFASKMVALEQPYRLPEARLFLLIDGELDVTVNLIKYHIGKGDIAYVSAGSIIQVSSKSELLNMMAVAMKEDMMRMVLNVNRNTVYNGEQSQILIHTDKHDFDFMRSSINLLLDVVHQENYSMDVVKSLFGAIYFNFDHLFTQQNQQSKQKMSRQHEVFNSFITLVHRHCREQRTIGFYADRLFLSERYLGSLVKEASGKTAKEWIETAVITEAKVLLKHSDYQITQIADALHFPNNSFFCKFFKRITGISPMGYRELE